LLRSEKRPLCKSARIAGRFVQPTKFPFTVDKFPKSGYQNLTVSATAQNSFNRTYRAVPESVPSARREICALAAQSGASPQKLENIRLTSSEALTNAVLHAYGGQPGALHVTAVVVDGEMWLLIADDGCGLQAEVDSPGLGLGLALIARCSDHFSIGPRGAGGVELRMRFNLAPFANTFHGLGSAASASRPLSSRFSTTI
jgi:anti-sigma regulatory factor (Ser/Thr protein kinase)